MSRWSISSLILMLVCAASVQSINLTGKVTSSGKPVQGAIVTLLIKQMKDTTDASGNYTISDGQVQVTPSMFIPSVEQISMNRGVIHFSIPKSAPVKVELFDMKGNLVRQVISHTMAAGDYRYDLSTDAAATGMLVVRVAIGARGATFRYLPVAGRYAGLASSISFSAPAINSLAKLQATVDSLKVEIAGYMPKTVAVSSVDGVINVALDTMAKFSFFVTSMAALQDLSKSQNGFGGNFSFGKTGPGAGLRGADSICECIAERSMPGSKVKKWRAFLSVKADENGKQINAIDRIGKGPWYDRLERLLAPTIGDLANQTRPMNGDAAIKNDLPNEDGIPNHQPDPAKPKVDNHHMVTGSDVYGKLYIGPKTSNAPTCDDWTSTSNTTDEPRCGFAWPRGGGGGSFGGSGSHWLSGFDAGGCKAGIEIVENGPGTGQSIIGSGGGYGGFYCFALVP